MYIHVCVHKKPYLEDYHSNLEQIYDQLNIILFYNQVVGYSAHAGFHTAGGRGGTSPSRSQTKCISTCNNISATSLLGPLKQPQRV